MKRTIINKYGDPEVLLQENFEIADIKEEQILIEQFATSINPIDIKIRRGDLKFITGKKFPKILGADFCGQVIQSKNKNFKEGDVLFGMLDVMRGGSYADQIIIEDKNCALKPENLTVYESAVIPVVGLTCYLALITHGDLQKGQKVFINGCTGGVGSLAVQIAKAIGAKVTGACSKKNTDFANQIDVDHIIDYNKSHLDNLSTTFDFVFDTAGKLSVSKLKKLGNKDAKYATTGFNFGLIMKSIFSKSFKVISVKPNAGLLNSLKEFLEANNIKPIIYKEWSIDNIQSAHKGFESGVKTGKTIIKIK